MIDNKTRIHTYELKLGMFISELDIPWSESPFKQHSQGFIITEREQLALLRDYCSYVFINVALQKKLYGAIPTNLTKDSDKSSFKDALAQATKSYQSNHLLIKNVLDDVRLGQHLNAAVAKEVVSDCVSNVLNNSDAMQLLTQLKGTDEYTAQHSLNVCVLAVLFGKSLKLSIENLNKLGMCGLLYDIGKSKIDLDTLNKKGDLAPKETAVIKNHVLLSKEILQNTPGIEKVIIDVAYTHHEKIDGSGYPVGLIAGEISTFAKIISIIDAYDAIISDKPYKLGKLHLEAIEVLAKGRKKHFDDKLVIKFIECIGIYPVGSPVELTNGEVAMVIESNATQKVKPIILLLLDSDKKPTTKKSINLANPAEADSKGKAYKLFKVIKHNSYGLNLPELHSLGIIADNL